MNNNSFPISPACVIGLAEAHTHIPSKYQSKVRFSCHKPKWMKVDGFFLAAFEKNTFLCGKINKSKAHS